MVPCDGNGDFDLIVSCPDKPSNGVWLFENTTGDTAKQAMPVFQPGRLLSKTVHYVMPSYVDGSMRVLSPGVEYLDFTKSGTEAQVKLPMEAKFHKPQGTQPKGPKMRHNQWRYVDYDGDLDLICGEFLDKFTYFENTGSRTTPVYSAGKRLTTMDGETMVMNLEMIVPIAFDWDRDGDLDLIVGDEDGRVAFVENLGLHIFTAKAKMPGFAEPKYL